MTRRPNGNKSEQDIWKAAQQSCFGTFHSDFLTHNDYQQIQPNIH